MRVLFVQSRKDCDYLASMLWDGLQEVLGEENVVDAVGSPWLHKSGCDSLCAEYVEMPGRSAHPPVVRGISGTREGLDYLAPSGNGFDLIVLNACFNRDWDWARDCLNVLKPNGKIAYVEGWDAAWHIEAPQMPVDVYFRKEIARNVQYPMQPHYLTFVPPARWFEPDSGDRPCDVFWSGNPDACLPGQEVRRPMLANIFRTRRSHRSVISTTWLGYDYYFRMLRLSKLALCPTGADLTDSLRTTEAAACGAIPVFIGYPDHIREPWFPNDACINCTADTLAEHIDEALSHDLTPRRIALREYALKHHTTAAQARRMLAVMGMTP